MANHSPPRAAHEPLLDRARARRALARDFPKERRRALRLAAPLTYREIAESVSRASGRPVSIQAVYHWERDEREPRAELVQHYYDVLRLLEEEFGRQALAT